MENNERIVSIDRFRGVMVFCMILFQYLERYDCFGWLGRIAVHRPEEGVVLLNNFTLADIGAPLFFFAIALNYVPSFLRRRERDGVRAAYLHFGKRGLGIMGFGGCLATIDDVFVGENWPYLKLALVMTVVCLLLGVFKLLTVWLKPLRSKSALAGKLLTTTLWVFGAVNLVNELVCLVPLIQGKPFYGSWQVLQAIGFAELIALAVVSCSTAVRAVTGIALLGFFTWIHEMPGNMEMIDIEVQGGVIGAVAWASMLLIFTVYADLYYKDRADWKRGKHSWRYLAAVAVSAAAGVIGYQRFYVNKGSVSPGYVLISIPISAALFLIAVAIGEKKTGFAPMIWWGENPILLFLLQYLFVNVPISVIPGADAWGFLPACIYAVGVVGLITWIAYRLDRQGKRVRL